MTRMNMLLAVIFLLFYCLPWIFLLCPSSQQINNYGRNELLEIAINRNLGSCYTAVRFPPSVKSLFVCHLKWIAMGIVALPYIISILYQCLRQRNLRKQFYHSVIHSLRKQTDPSKFRFSSFSLDINVYGLEDMFREVLSPFTSDLPLMRYEWSRYETFKSYPTDGPSSPSKLAANGFYYTRQGTDVKCFSCNVLNNIWPENETVAETHKRISPNCMFQNCHVPIHENSDNTGPNRYPKFADFEQRMLSFVAWPHENLFHVNFAAAGLFYTGIGDLCRCFSCGGGFKDWSAGDDPYKEHAHYSPKCAFIKKLKRRDNCTGLQQERNDVNDQQPSMEIRSPQYREVETRLATFKTFPRRDVIPVVRMALAGLFYTGKWDFCRCFSCGGGLKNWNAGDDPYTEHAKHFPSCGFIKTLTRRDNFTGLQEERNSANDQQPSMEIRSPQYREVETRLATFKTFPRRDVIPVVRMALAGLFYTGKWDLCRCFSCGGGFKNWSAGDDPYTEHAKHFPSCGFIKTLTNIDNFTGLQEERNSANDNEGEHAESVSPSASETVTENLYSSAIQLFVSMGHSENFVKAAIEDLRIINEDKPVTMENISEYILDTEPNLVNPTNSNDTLPRSTKNLLSNQDPETDERRDREMQEQGRLLEENHNLKHRLACKICLDNDACIVFVPCGHMVVCMQCSSRQNRCAICRADIEDRIRAYPA